MPEFDREFLEGLHAIGADGTKRPPPVAPTDPTEEIETVDVVPELGTTSAPVLVSAVTLQNILRHPDAHPIVLDLLLIHKYNLEWMLWEPETLDIRIPQDFKTSVSEVNLGKIHSMATLHLVDTFWERWEVFLWCTMALNGIPPDFESMQVPTVAQILVACDIANRTRDDMSWSPEIRAFIESVYRHDDIFLPIPPADFVTLDTEGFPIDVAEVAKKWPDVRASGKAPKDATVTAEQLRRLLIVNHYLEESRSHLRQQLPLVSRA